ncbi:hypothetical protein B0T17DRAFT_633777 [Bombardia bombarda]|uniref:F-box domain-containing protein n=1 Tax=Bombardia bombarda TaxID=252184 RepID=A0AA39X8U4_9PEZI|nr:hypothetical protein B0T17DRAFT_633777 [Bombardia bombarda]
MAPHLADEILLNIFFYLELEVRELGNKQNGSSEWDALKALSRLCAVSRRFKHLAQPLLYTTVPDLSGKYDARLGKYVHHARQNFMRTLGEQPHLTEAIRAFRVVNWWPDVGPLFETMRANGYLDGRISDTFLARLYATIETDKDHEEPTEAPMMLSLFPNLELLDIEWNYSQNLTLEFVREAASAGTHFSRLREVRVRHWDTEMATQFDAILPLMLPSVWTFRGWAISWEGTDGIWEETDKSQDLADLHRLLNLQHVELNQSLCDPNGLAYMLDRCPKLRILKIDWSSCGIGGSSDLNMAEFGNALREHYPPSLEELVLDPVDHDGCNEVFNPLGSLRGLSQLKRLGLAEFVLLGEPRSWRQSAEDALRRGENNSEAGGTLLSAQVGGADGTTTASTAISEPVPAAYAPTLDDFLPDSLEKLHIYEAREPEDTRAEFEALDDQICDLLLNPARQNSLKEIRISCRDTPFPKVDMFKDMGWSTWTEQNRKYVWTYGKREVDMVLARRLRR